MKIRTTFFVFTLLLTTLTAQKRAPVATALTAFAETFSTRLTALASDTSITFEQVQPLFATLFEQHRRKTRRAVATETSQRYLVIVTLDGFRWQEVFGGADSLLLHDPLYTPDTATYRQRYWAATATQRRQQLLPFIWGALAAEGQLPGDGNDELADQSRPGPKGALRGMLHFCELAVSEQRFGRVPVASLPPSCINIPTM